MNKIVVLSLLLSFSLTSQASTHYGSYVCSVDLSVSQNTGIEEIEFEILANGDMFGENTFNLPHAPRRSGSGYYRSNVINYCRGNDGEKKTAYSDLEQRTYWNTDRTRVTTTLTKEYPSSAASCFDDDIKTLSVEFNGSSITFMTFSQSEGLEYMGDCVKNENSNGRVAKRGAINNGIIRVSDSPGQINQVFRTYEP